MRSGYKTARCAKNAAKYSIHSFSNSVRPKSIGEYNSPYKIKNLDLDQLMDILIKSNILLRGSKKIISATSMARIVNMEMNFVSSNGSNLNQNFLTQNHLMIASYINIYGGITLKTL